LGFGISGLDFGNNKELIPAIRSNLFMANPAMKRISAAIGAGKAVFGRSFGMKEGCRRLKNRQKTAFGTKKPSKAGGRKGAETRKIASKEEKSYAW